MNIFAVDSCPVKSAWSLADVHVNKMIIESCQMLANAYSPEELARAPKTQKGTIRKYSYLHHPCSKWVLESQQNFEWLLIHAIALVEEKLYRTQKKHCSLDFLMWCWYNRPTLPDKGLTKHALAMPDEYKVESFVESYKSYYKSDKTHLFSWTKRQKPVWIGD